MEQLVIAAALMAAASAIALFAFCRCFVPNILALATTAMMAVSPHQLEILTKSFKEYWKQPFLLTTMFLLALALKTSSRRTLYVTSASAGLVMGLGLGFGTDLLAALPFFCLVLAGKALTQKKLRLASAASVGVVSSPFFLGQLPVLRYYAAGGGIGHVALLGWTTPFDDTLGVTRPPYDIGSQYNDFSVESFVNGYSYAKGASKVTVLTSEYEKTSMSALIDLYKLFPADGFAHLLGAVIRTANVEFTNNPSVLSNVVSNPLVIRGSGLMLIAGATVLLASTELSLAILYASVFLFFSSLGSVQFSLRHIYYLEVFYWLSAAIILRFLFRAALSLSRHRRIGLFQVRLILMPSAVVVGIFVALTGTLSGLQAYQQSGVVDLIERYLAAPRSNIEFDIEQEGASTLYRPRGTFRNFGGIQVAFAGRENNAFYLLLTLDGTACSAPVLPVRVEYAAKGPASEISRDMYMMFGTDRGPSYLFIPVRNAVNSRFQGFRIPTNQRACLAHIQSVSGSANLSLPLWIRLPAEWRSLRFYQAFERPIVRWPFSSTNLVSVTNPPQFATDLGGRKLDIWPLNENRWDTVEPPAQLLGQAIRLTGAPKFGEAYAAISNKLQLIGGSWVAARGLATHGGLVLGILDKDNRWAGYVKAPLGSFQIAVKVPADGEYRIAISYNLPAGPQSTINAEVTEVGLVGLDPSAVRAPDEPKPQFEIMPLERSAWEQQVPPARIAGRVIGLQGHPDNPLGYAMVSSRYQLTKGTLVAVAGRVRQGGITVGLLDGREQWAATKAISPGAFSTGVEVPADGEYRIAISYNLPAGPQSPRLTPRSRRWVLLASTRPAVLGFLANVFVTRFWRVICRWGLIRICCVEETRSRRQPSVTGLRARSLA